MNSDRDSDIAGVVRETRDGVVLALRVTPKARRPGVLGVRRGALACAVSAAPERGKATAEALGLVAEWLGLAASRVRLGRGAASRDKTVIVSGISASDLRKRIEQGLARSARGTG